MIIFFSIAGVDPLLDRGLELTTPEKGKLHLVFALEEKVPQALSSIMAYIGFLGEKVKSDMEASVISNYYNQVETITTEAKEKAAKKNIALIDQIIEHEIKENCIQLIEEQNVEHLLINYTRDDYFIHSSLSNQLNLLLPELKITYELYLDGVKAEKGEYQNGSPDQT